MTHVEIVKVGFGRTTKPQAAAQIAGRLGYDPRGVSKALGTAAKAGLVSKTEEGWVKL